MGSLPAAMILSALIASLAVSATPASPRCTDDLAEVASRLHQRDAKARYLALVRTCGTDPVVALTRRLVSFATVSSEKPAKDSPTIAAMGQFLEGWAKERGFAFRAFGKNDVFEITWGEGAPVLGYVLHGDVVPATPGEWSHAPFDATVDGGQLYGRGVEDDKGPLAAVLTSLAMAKAVGLSPRGAIRVMIGNGEESDWTGMTAYAQSRPPPAQVISVDADYPVVAAQSGFVIWGLTAPVDAKTMGTGGTLRAVDAAGGEFLTLVPGEATLRLEPVGIPLTQAKAEVSRALATLKASRHEFSAELTSDGGTLVVTTHGKAVHSSVADHGHDALWDLGAVSLALPLVDNGIAAMLHVLGQRFDGDLWGEKLGIAYGDPLMGKLLVVPTLLRVKEGRITLGINMRRPQGKDAAAFGKSLDAALAAIAQGTGGRVTELPGPQGRNIGDAFVANTSGPLVQKLLELFASARHQKSVQPIAVRGGTYARLFPGAVDFGPNLPGTSYAGHAPNESISLDNLRMMTQLLAESTWTFALEPAAR